MAALRYTGKSKSQSLTGVQQFSITGGRYDPLHFEGTSLPVGTLT